MLRNAIDYIRHLIDGGEPADDEKPLQKQRHRANSFIVDTGEQDRQQITAALQSAKIIIDPLPNGEVLNDAVVRARPDVLFMGIGEGGEAAAAERLRKLPPHAVGAVQLIGENGHVALDPLTHAAHERGLRTLSPLAGPVSREAIDEVIAGEGLSRSANGTILVDLGLAIRNGWVEFWYQPKVDLARRTLIGAESLARVRHPTHGLMLPASFLPNASDADLTRLGQEAIKTAMRDWDAFHRLHYNLRLTVNVPVGATHADRIVMLIGSQPYGAAWPGLILEIEEADLLASKVQAKAIQQELKPHGVLFAVDNAGATGHFLADLGDIDFAELKMARKLVHGVAGSPQQQLTCRSYIDFAHRRRAVAAANGLETVPDGKTLIELGCDIGQGSVFAPALQRAQFVNMLKRQRQVATGQA